MDEYASRDGGIRLCEISNGYQFVTDMRYASQIRRIMATPGGRGSPRACSRPSPSSPTASRVLAEVDELRGVSSRQMVANLMKKNLIKPVGRKELPAGRLPTGPRTSFSATSA
jgi:segregation and condensation protein B